MKTARRSARIVGGGSQRGPTERRQQAESLAHSFSLWTIRSLLLLTAWSRLLSFSFWSPLLHSSYSRFAHPPLTAHSYVRASVCVREMPGAVRNRQFMGLTDHAGVFSRSRDGDRLPALISGRFDLRIFVPFIALSFLASSCSPHIVFCIVLLSVFLLLAGPGAALLFFLKECSRYGGTMGITRGRNAYERKLGALLEHSGGTSVAVVMPIGLAAES